MQIAKQTLKMYNYWLCKALTKEVQWKYSESSISGMLIKRECFQIEIANVIPLFIKEYKKQFLLRFSAMQSLCKKTISKKPYHDKQLFDMASVFYKNFSESLSFFNRFSINTAINRLFTLKISFGMLKFVSLEILNNGAYFTGPKTIHHE